MNALSSADGQVEQAWDLGAVRDSGMLDDIPKGEGQTSTEHYGSWAHEGHVRGDRATNSSLQLQYRRFAIVALSLGAAIVAVVMLASGISLLPGPAHEQTPLRSSEGRPFWRLGLAAPDRKQPQESQLTVEGQRGKGGWGVANPVTGKPGASGKVTVKDIDSDCCVKAKAAIAAHAVTDCVIGKTETADISIEGGSCSGDVCTGFLRPGFKGTMKVYGLTSACCSFLKAPTGQPPADDCPSTKYCTELSQTIKKPTGRFSVQNLTKWAKTFAPSSTAVV